MASRRAAIDWRLIPLGDAPDAELAFALGVSPSTVARHRRARDRAREAARKKRAAQRKKRERISWATLPYGDLPDAELAFALGVDQSRVRRARKKYAPERSVSDFERELGVPDAGRSVEEAIRRRNANLIASIRAFGTVPPHGASEDALEALRALDLKTQYLLRLLYEGYDETLPREIKLLGTGKYLLTECQYLAEFGFIWEAALWELSRKVEGPRPLFFGDFIETTAGKMEGAGAKRPPRRAGKPGPKAKRRGQHTKQSWEAKLRRERQTRAREQKRQDKYLEIYQTKGRVEAEKWRRVSEARRAGIRRASKEKEKGTDK